MNHEVRFSNSQPSIEWSETQAFAATFGVKAANLLAIPRAWTPPFAVISTNLVHQIDTASGISAFLSNNDINSLQELNNDTGHVIVRSSIVGETIWDRGSYRSVILNRSGESFLSDLHIAIKEIVASAPKKSVGIIVQSFISPGARGEFGNLVRISKTRDHWELSNERDGIVGRTRLNTQRDTAANSNNPLHHRVGLSQERLFGSIAAWVNNNLLRGHSPRVTCEWVATSRTTFIVQIDQEDEDFLGVNPFQIRIDATHEPVGSEGKFIRQAHGSALDDWDKLQVLNELSENGKHHKPKLFFLPFKVLQSQEIRPTLEQLTDDFSNQIGPDGIVVRTSVRAGQPKVTNLKRSEGMTPLQAAEWVLKTFDEFQLNTDAQCDYAFVMHRFMAARASAWAKAIPDNPIVDLHCLWGLPDALQYCPFDSWEVHLPTETATDYIEYKSNMLVARDDGQWEYVRIKNDLGRSACVGRHEALEIAHRTAAIAKRMNKPMHIMWFVGCKDQQDNDYNVPWYWVEAHDSEKNTDRSSYDIFEVESEEHLAKLNAYRGDTHRLAVELKPTTQRLMRDEKFIADVGKIAHEMGIPVILSGSTLAHAYYVLRRQHCTVVTRGEKEHSRVRRNAVFGKLVRDKIPEKIVGRGESELTKTVPSNLKRGFLLAKLIEEALEVRNASKNEVLNELADLYEVVRTLIKLEGHELFDVSAAADTKRDKAGGFDDGLVLLQTGILGRDKTSLVRSAASPTQVLSRRTSGDTFEIPFTIFGFMESDQPRNLFFDNLGIYLSLTLKNDKLVLEMSREAQQLELVLDVGSETETD